MKRQTLTVQYHGQLTIQLQVYLKEKVKGEKKQKYSKCAYRYYILLS